MNHPILVLAGSGAAIDLAELDAGPRLPLPEVTELHDRCAEIAWRQAQRQQQRTRAPSSPRRSKGAHR